MEQRINYQPCNWCPAESLPLFKKIDKKKQSEQYTYFVRVFSSHDSIGSLDSRIYDLSNSRPTKITGFS